MKTPDELTFDESVKYSKEHTWAKVEGDTVVVGISDYAQDQLGEIIFVELPQPGDHFGADEAFGVVESVKTASDLYMPIGGEITEVNEDLDDAPEKINSTPFTDGWMIKIKAEDPSAVENLLDAQAYRDSLQQ